ncbi:hypothetical protein EVAR_14308_1 [Eumeta japonica]|uniref:Uncharacterized protein n=1 Tax=Eumeta variegata TaxID=151549 RepID=A0A4C1UN24_EUMVA|nr:hypothetical protein EVAR_14308_1 [Eumeta japonica]
MAVHEFKKRLRLGVTYEKSVTLGNVTMSHRTREARRMPCVSLPLNYDRSAARSTRELVHSLQNVLQVIAVISSVYNSSTALADDALMYSYSISTRHSRAQRRFARQRRRRLRCAVRTLEPAMLLLR